MTQDLPTLAQAKQRAKRLRAALFAEGMEVSHSEALERIAKDAGFRDWNSMHAKICDLPAHVWSVEDRVSGRYLSQPFTARILSVEDLRPGWVRLELALDEAVDVVRFDSFSNLRRRLLVEVGPDGRSQERTSNGEPHLELDL